MPTSSNTLQPELIRDQITALLHRHWTTPVVGSALPSLPIGEELDKLTRDTFDVMMTRQFRTGPMPEESIQRELLDRIRLFVSQGLPIKITLGYAPLKNQNAVNYSRADWAEFFALGHLVAWHNKVQKIYSPGLRIQIVFDDATLRMANHTNRQVMRSYMKSVSELTQAMGYGSIFPRPFAQSRFAWLFHFGVYQWAALRVRRWERLPEAREQIEKMDQAATRNLSYRPGLTPLQQIKVARKASHRYRVYWEALQLVGFTRSKKRLIAMYLDGTQHHIKQTVALHLTTLDKGQVTQPWQGEGVLMDNGHGKWEPAVMTANRRLRSMTATLGELDLLPMPGFDRITLAQTIAAASQPADEKTILRHPELVLRAG